MKFVNPAESRLATPGLVHETVRLLSFHFGCPRRETGDMTSTLTPRSVYKDVLGGIVFLDHGAKMVPFFGSFFLCLEEGLYAVLVVRLDLLDLGQRRDLGSGTGTLGPGSFCEYSKNILRIFEKRFRRSSRADCYGSMGVFSLFTGGIVRGFGRTTRSARSRSTARPRVRIPNDQRQRGVFWLGYQELEWYPS